MRTLILAFTLFLFSVQEIQHVDPMLPVVPAAAAAGMRWPLVCDTGRMNTFQFLWVAAPGEVVERAAVEARLRDVAEQVNWLFWRDSDSVVEARLPAWKVTADCRLDVRWGDEPTGGTVPTPGQTKLLQIEPADDFCGYAYLAPDDRPGAENIHNRSSFAVVARRCLSAYGIAHEMLHMIGAVQPSAPHGTEDFHSTEFDIMGRPSEGRCAIHDKIDCGNDDYFSLIPSGYLAEHWNSADSVFLLRERRHLVWVPIGIRND